MTQELVFEEKPIFNRTLNFLRLACLFVLGVIAYAGGFALWIWAIQLIFVNWGPFWAIVSFVVFPLPLVVIVMCMFWGVWYFLLGFGAWLISAFTFGYCSDRDEPALRIVLPATILALACALGTGYRLWADISDQGPFSDHKLESVHNDALSVLAVMRAATDDEDAQSALFVIEATSELKKRISRYSDRRISMIRDTVDLYIEYERAVIVDMTDWVEDVIEGERVEFQRGKHANESYEMLPRRFQLLADRDQIGMNLLQELRGYPKTTIS